MRIFLGRLFLTLSGFCFLLAGIAPVALVAYKWYEPKAYESEAFWSLGWGFVVVPPIAVLALATLLNALGNAVQGERISGRR